MSEQPEEQLAPDWELVCTCTYSPGDEGFIDDPDCPTHSVEQG